VLSRFTCSDILTNRHYRYNTRKDMNDAERFSLAVSQITGKRLTYAELTGKTEAGTCEEEA
jgi:hypothetical protein